MPVSYWTSDIEDRIGVDDTLYGGTAYPFLLECEASGTILDIHVATASFQVPTLRLQQIFSYGVGYVYVGSTVVGRSSDIVLTDDDGHTIDTRGMSSLARSWGGGLISTVWWDQDSVIQMVYRRSVLVTASYDWQDAWLDPRALAFTAPDVSSVSVRTETGWQSAIRSDGSIKIKPGYNVRLATEQLISPRGERQSELTISARAGDGAGRFAGCDSGLGITLFGGAAPNPAGDLLLGGDDCITFGPELQYGPTSASIVPGSFIVRDACEAKCECADFSSVASYAIAVWNRFTVLADRAKSIRDRYHAVRNQLASWLECSQLNPLKLNVWRAPPCGLGLGFGIMNVSDVCLEGLSLTLRLLDGPDGALLAGAIATRNGVFSVDYLGTRGYAAAGDHTESGGIMTFVLKPIKPGQMGFVFVRYELPEGECDRSGTAVVGVTGSFPASWTPPGPISLNF